MIPATPSPLMMKPKIPPALVRRDVFLQVPFRVVLRLPGFLEKNEQAVRIRIFVLDRGPVLLFQ
jgi:hypothetical protein